ncbi:MAG: hypothetical protein HFH10_12490 [Dorea sp.]|nr:hypothetical protein [Dorea sp.]
MNVYITKVNGLSLENPLQYKQWMTAKIAHRLDFREMGYSIMMEEQRAKRA